MEIILKGALALFYFINTNIIKQPQAATTTSPERNLPKNVLFSKNEFKESTPDRIFIPNLSIELPIKSTNVVNGTWLTYNDAASFKVGSANINDPSGNTVVFAHAKSGLFKGIDKLKAGDSILVRSEDIWHEFEVSKRFYVDPKDVSFLNRNFGKSLILLTCYGEDDEQRVVIVAKEKGSHNGQKIV
jgi:LPXTG-site transpeptidase (sortase) family protein